MLDILQQYIDLFLSTRIYRCRSFPSGATRGAPGRHCSAGVWHHDTGMRGSVDTARETTVRPLGHRGGWQLLTWYYGNPT